MADVYNFVAPTGVITTNAGTILAGVQAEYKNTFGQDLIVTPNTPQGMLIGSETLARIAVADNNAAVANQINPNVAGGVFLDALLSLLGSFRATATQSTVLCTITGVPGTSIPSGAQASETGSGNSNLFQIVSTTVIPPGGSISNVPFVSVLTGPIPANTSTLTVIVSNILGWETVTNPAAAVLGTATQSDTSARALRQVTLGAQGTGFAEAITSALYLTSGVTSLTFQENVSNTTQIINKVSMAPHSLYTCVAGTATNLAVATTLTNTKSGGCGYNNGSGVNVSQAVVNPFSQQSITVLFDTPAFMNINIVATVHAFTTVQNIDIAVKNAILAYAAGQIPNEPGFAVGQSVSPFQIAGAINILVPGLFVQEVQVSINSLTETGTISNGFNTVTGLGDNAGINVGAAVSGTGIPGGTTVASLVGTTGLTLSATATTSATELLTFVPLTPALQTTEIPLNVWQQAVALVGLISVIQIP